MERITPNIGGGQLDLRVDRHGAMPTVAAPEQRAALRRSRTIVGEIQDALRRAGRPEAEHPGPPVEEEDLEAAQARVGIQEVCLRMMSAVAAELARAQRAEARARTRAAPLVRAAIDRDLFSVRELALRIGVPEATISQFRRNAPRIRLEEMQIEIQLDQAIAVWRAETHAVALAGAHRWRWFRVGHTMGLTLRAMAAVAGVSPEDVRKDVNSRPGPDDQRVVLLAESEAHVPGLVPVAGTPEDLALRAALREALEERPDDPGIAFAAGWYLHQHEDPDEGDAMYARAAEHGHACAAHNLGAAAEGRGDLADAEQWYRRADELGHACPSAWALGQLLLKAEDRFPEAMDAFERATDRGVVAAAIQAARALHDRDDHETERGWWERAAKLGDVGSARWLAGHHDGKGATGLANRFWRAAAEAGDAESAEWLACRIMEDDPEQAQELLEQAARAGRLSAARLLAAHIGDRAPRRAISAWRLARELGDDSPPVVLAALLEQHANGKPEMLAEALQLWLEVADKGAAIGLLRAGSLARALGNDRQAEDLLWRALAGDDPDAAAGAVFELAEKRRPHLEEDAAVITFAEEAFGLGYEQVALPLVDVLERKGRRRQAIEVLDRALSLAPSAHMRAELLAERTWQQYCAAEGDVLVMARARWVGNAKSGSRRALRYLAQTAHDARSLGNAIESFSALIELGEPCHRELADALYADGRVQAAKDAAREGAAVGEHDCHALLGKIALEVDGELDSALALWQNGIEIRDWESGALAGQALIAAGQNDRARMVLNETVRQGSSCAHSLLGTLAYGRDRGLALDQFRKARDKGCFHGAYNLAVALLDNPHPTADERREARAALQMAAQSRDLEAALLLAELSARDGEAELAPVLLEAAVDDVRAGEVVAKHRPREHPDLGRRPRTSRLRRLREAVWPGR